MVWILVRDLKVCGLFLHHIYLYICEWALFTQCWGLWPTNLTDIGMGRLPDWCLLFQLNINIYHTCTTSGIIVWWGCFQAEMQDSTRFSLWILQQLHDNIYTCMHILLTYSYTNMILVTFLYHRITKEVWRSAELDNLGCDPSKYDMMVTVFWCVPK